MWLTLVKRALFALAVASLASGSGRAFESRFYAIEAQVQARRTPPGLVFSWVPREEARAYIIRRKSAGQNSWNEPVANLPGSASGFTDANVAVGVAYEYEIQMESALPAPEGGWISAYSYLWAGIDVPEKHTRGRVILMVDGSVAPALAAELEMYRADLVGAGWSVVQREVSRTAPVPDVKTMIRNEYNANPGNTRAVVLIGHVPVPYSGDIAPDMHWGHRGAWVADVYYGDMNGTWTDQTVSVRGVDYSENDNLPGDGKFDQSVLPTPAELEVGRIDFWGLTGFEGRNEVDLLKNYFRKNHAFRHRVFTAPRQGLVRDNFGDFEGDAPAVDAWRHYDGFFGAGRVREVGPGEFFSALSTDGYLWAYGCGGGANDKADGVGSTQDFAASDPRAVFLMLHGSYFGDWNYPDNFLRASIATPSYTLASVWTGLPHWYLHHMALGETIGYSTRLTQNNLSLYRSHRNFSPGEVHISLIGDPTLEMFPVRPPSNLTGSVDGDVRLSWSPSGDENVLGYYVYHGTTSQGPYTRVNPEPISGTSFAHNVGAGVHYYMVRAVKLETTGSGTFRNLSQGVFASVQKSSGPISTTPGVTVLTEDAEAAEFRANSGSFKFTRDAVDGNALVVYFDLSGAAQNGVDYLPVVDSITIPAWSASVVLTVYPRSDELSEGDESVAVQIRNHAAYRVLSPSSASFAIRDNPPAVNQRPTISSLPDQVIRAGETREAAFTVGDPDSPAAALTVRASSSNSTLVPNGNLLLGGTGANRSLRIAVPAGVNGSAQVVVTVSDGLLEASSAFTVTVPQNEAPIASGAQVVAVEDIPQPIVLSGTDPEGGALQYRVVKGPAHGELSGTAPMLVYTPAGNAHGSDSFTFVVSDGTLESAPALIAIEVAPVNDAPRAVDDFVEASEMSLTIPLSTLLANDVDPDGDVLTVIGASNASTNGGVVVLMQQSLVFTPAKGFSGTDSFQYTIADSMGLTATGTVRVAILERPVITSVVPSAEGVAIGFRGPAGKTARVEASPDAQTWLELGTATIGENGLGEFVDAEIGVVTMKLYRLEIQ